MDREEMIVDTVGLRLRESAALKEQLAGNPEIRDIVRNVSNEIIVAFRAGRKVLFCGNGGSAADAQHLAAEFSGRFYFDRQPLPAEALHVNTSYMTAVGNDYSFDEVYSRMVRGSGKDGDVLIGISTSGNSKNIMNAMSVANEIGMKTIAMTGLSGGTLKDVANICIRVPSEDTPRIQEAHITIGHIICEIVERELFPEGAR